jgi:hypothetical protein
MAIQEYTDELNNVSVTSTKSAIVLNNNSEIVDEIVKGSTNIISPHKIVVGTHTEIDNYISDNLLSYAEVPLPSVEE